MVIVIKYKIGTVREISIKDENLPYVNDDGCDDTFSRAAQFVIERIADGSDRLFYVHEIEEISIKL